MFYQPTNTALYYCCGTSLSNVQVKNNITYGGRISDPISGATFSGNRDYTDPKLVSPSTYDSHLQAGSPAIDAGVILTEVTIDLDGIIRPQGVFFDIGAYEYPTTVAAPAAPTNLQVGSP